MDSQSTSSGSPVCQPAANDVHAQVLDEDDECVSGSNQTVYGKTHLHV